MRRTVINQQMAFRGRNVSNREAVLTPTVVGIAIWMMFTFATFRTRNINDLLGANSLDFQVLFQAVSWSIFALLAFYLYARGRFKTELIQKGPLLWYSGFVGLAALSISYSAVPVLTTYYVMQLVALVVIVCSMDEKREVLYRLIVLYVGINWILLLLGMTGLNFGLDWITTAEVSYERYGGSPGELWRFSTALGHPSQIAVVSAIAAVGLAASRDRWRLKGVTIALLILTVILTFSRTAIVGMVAGFIPVVWSRRWFSAFTGIACFAALVALGFSDIGDRLLDAIMRGQSAEEFASLTGRSAIYAVALGRAETNVLGDGFGSLRSNPLLGEEWGQGVAHAHNLLLQAYIELGIAGALATIATLGSLVIYAVKLAWPNRRTRAIPDIETIAVLLPVLAFCTFDSGFAVGANPFVAVFISVCARARRKKLADLKAASAYRVAVAAGPGRDAPRPTRNAKESRWSR